MNDAYMKYAVQLKNEKLSEMETLYQTCLPEYSAVFQENFRSICENIVAMQKNGDLGEISYLEYTFLYTDLIRKKESAEVRVYNDNWYFDSSQKAVGSFDYSFLFTKYRELRDELMACRKRYAGAVTAQEAVSFLLSCAKQFYKYVSAVCRFSILPCVGTEPFRSVRRAGKFEINTGEYMAVTEAVYKENRLRTSKDALEWLAMRHEYEYAYEDFSGLDFSGADLSETDLRYADLRHARLTGTDFRDALLVGTRFCHASLQKADFRYCLLHEADFTGADLSGACFHAASACSGLSGTSGWNTAGYRKVSFRDADLENADFTDCRIRDADFTGAIMDGAILPESRRDDFALSSRQAEAVHFTDA